jgi:hypothetical protein
MTLRGEQNVRRALVDSMPREWLIAAIVGHLRRHAQARQEKAWAGGRPRDWYVGRIRL